MRKFTKYAKLDIPSGTTRLRRRFAYLPIRIDGYDIWLETYEVLEAWINTDYKLIEDGKEKAFRVSEWKEISKRVIN